MIMRRSAGKLRKNDVLKVDAVIIFVVRKNVTAPNRKSFLLGKPLKPNLMEPIPNQMVNM